MKRKEKLFIRDINIPQYPSVAIMKDTSHNGGLWCRLSPPSWDCNWYWGWGYLGHRDLHTHWHSTKQEYNENKEKREYLYCLIDIDNYYRGNQKYQSIKWELEDLMSSFYKLREVAEIYHRGSSNFSGKSYLSILHNNRTWKRINEKEIPAIFKKFYELIDSIDNPKNTNN